MRLRRRLRRSGVQHNLMAIIKKRLNLQGSLFQLLQILSVTVFERTPLHQLLTLKPLLPESSPSDKQLNLFGF